MESPANLTGEQFMVKAEEVRGKEVVLQEGETPVWNE